MTSPDADSKVATPKQQSILDLSAADAKKFFLKHESYCSIDLPPYFRFDKLLRGVDEALEGKRLSELINNPRDYENVNHLLMGNKDGKYAWRPLQLIHPALYVSLVRKLTEEGNWQTICDRFAKFAGIENITCLSLPVQSLTEEKDKAAQITQWWREIEQKSIELALDYEYIVHSDIIDCYGSIYTHSIAWAIHEKSVAKSKRNDKTLIGNVIDAYMQDMSHGQTNGIPQGSVLIDFIAEMVLGYADIELRKRISNQSIKDDYYILRYRDDYRIFVNNPQDGGKILKCLTEVMISLGLKLNATKTRVSDSVIRDSIKPDKLAWMKKKHWEKSLQKHLLIIYEHSREFPNSGSVTVALFDYYKRLSLRKKIQDALPLISIAVDMAYRNPRTYSICSAILSKLLSVLPTMQDKQMIVKKIMKRFSQIPNTGHMEIWLQRISLRFATDIAFKEPLCLLVHGKSVSIWENAWITCKKLKKAIDAKLIFDRDIANKLDPTIPPKEVELFIARSEYYK